MDAKRAAQPDWPTVRYMIAGIQYAGRITDDFDRLLMVGGGRAAGRGGGVSQGSRLPAQRVPAALRQCPHKAQAHPC